MSLLTPEDVEGLMEQKIDLTNGGSAVVMIGASGFVKEYANDPRVRFIDTKEVEGDILATLVPDNTKVVIITEGIPKYHYNWTMSYCSRKNMPYLVRRSNQAVYETLKGFFANGKQEGVTQEEAAQTREHGKLNALIQFIDFTKSNSECGKILLRKAHDLGIKTTLGSVTQLVANQRRKQSGGTVPKSARSQLDISVELLDNMIRDLASMRDYLIQTTEENRLLKAKYDRLRKAVEE